MRRAFFAAALLFGALAEAQDRGTMTVTGTVSEMASLRFLDEPDGPARESLSYYLDLGSLAPVPGRDDGVRGAEVTLVLRSNAPYVLSAEVQGEGFREGEGELSLADIGFGVPVERIVPSGSRARNDGLLVLARGVEQDPRGLSSPKYPVSLEDLSRGRTALLRGDRISYGGTNSSPENGLLVPTTFAVQPSRFSPNDGFSARVTYTISTP